MGQRSTSETVILIFQAFLKDPTWKQADLARFVGITTHALRKRLDELVVAGIPLDRSEESRSEVYWSVPRRWFPGGAYFDSSELESLVEQLAHLPPSEERERLMQAASRCLREREHMLERIRQVIVPPRGEAPQHRALLARSAMDGTAVRCKYHSRHRGDLSDRHISVQRVEGGPRAKCLAVCHRSGRLQWFRLDALVRVELDPNEPYRKADPSDVDAVLQGSVGGFFEEGEPVEATFRLVGDGARWAVENLPAGMTAERTDFGFRVTARTATVHHVARHVVSLGRVAEPETPVLAREVARIAKEALEAAERHLAASS